MLHFIGFLITGLVAGLLARALLPGRQDLSIPKTTILGMLGAVLVGFIGRALGWYGPDDGAGFIAATLGAIAVLAIYISVAKRGSIRNDRSDTNFPRKAA